jgi:hypothetical protein
VAVVAKVAREDVPHAPIAMSAVTAWAIALRATANAPKPWETVHLATQTATHAVGTALKDKAVSALPANLTTVAHATMHHANHVTMTMTTSNRVPTPTWARKVA